MAPGFFKQTSQSVPQTNYQFHLRPTSPVEDDTHNSVNNIIDAISELNLDNEVGGALRNSTNRVEPPDQEYMHKMGKISRKRISRTSPYSFGSSRKRLF